MPHVIVDPESTSLQQRYALIKTPRPSRKRYPAACVEIVDSEDAARNGTDPDRKLHAAVVYGPSISSEGQRIYYLVHWL